jgi:hypothetical protein
MCTIVIKSKEKNNPGMFWNPNWPKDAVRAYRNFQHEPWQFTTVSDILNRKKEKMEEHLRYKRRDESRKRIPLYVWVFFVPGVLFGGWYLYLMGHGIGEGKNYRITEADKKELLKLFSLVETSLFGELDETKWKIAFAKKYQRGMRGGKPQGKSLIWADWPSSCFRGGK